MHWPALSLILKDKGGKPTMDGAFTTAPGGSERRYHGTTVSFAEDSSRIRLLFA